MKREYAIFLLVGFAFGAVFGAGFLNAIRETPEMSGAAASAADGGPRGPMAPTQSGVAQGGPQGAPQGAPMMAEIRALRQQLEANPQDVASLVRLANLYHDASMFGEAIGYYEQALAIRPDEPDLLTDLGICFRGSEQYDLALESFRKAQESDPTHWQSLFNIVVVAGFDLGRFDVAREALETMERMDPAPPRLDELRAALERAESQG